MPAATPALAPALRTQPRPVAHASPLGSAFLSLLLSSLPLVPIAAHAQAQSPADATPPPALDDSDMPPGYPSLNAPWTAGTARKSKAPPAAPAPEAAPKPAPPATQEQIQPPPPETGVQASTPDTAASLQPRIRKHELSASGDFFLGQGNVTMPFGFSLSGTSGGANIIKSVAKPDRTSDYFGGTLSYSYGQAWFLDLAYAHGTSSGNADVLLGSPPTLTSAFTINDDWYQAYIRYTFPGLRGKRFSAYLRAGFSYVQATLSDTTTIPNLGLYHQDDKTDDLLGNLGFGVGYSLYASRHVRLGLQGEGEGFFGQRSQKSTEGLASSTLQFPTADISNDLYGGIVRLTLRFEYRLGSSGAFKLFADGGFQGKFTVINYSGLGSFDEMLYGPYVKAGVRYSF